MGEFSPPPPPPLFLCPLLSFFFLSLHRPQTPQPGFGSITFQNPGSAPVIVFKLKSKASSL